MKKLPLLITTGEPAGIGMDVVLLLAQEGKLQDFSRPIWVTAAAEAMQARADKLVAAGVLSTCPSWQTITAQVNAEDFVEQIAQQTADFNHNKHTFILLDIPCGAPVVAGHIDINTVNKMPRAAMIEVPKHDLSVCL